jgi:hypothetical protein
MLFLQPASGLCIGARHPVKKHLLAVAGIICCWHNEHGNDSSSSALIITVSEVAVVDDVAAERSRWASGTDDHDSTVRVDAAVPARPAVGAESDPESESPESSALLSCTSAHMGLTGPGAVILLRTATAVDSDVEAGTVWVLAVAASAEAVVAAAVAEERAEVVAAVVVEDGAVGVALVGGVAVAAAAFVCLRADSAFLMSTVLRVASQAMYLVKAVTSLIRR